MTDPLKIERLREALRNLIRAAEAMEITIENEWGSDRTLAEIERDGDLSPEIVEARAVLAQGGES